MAKLAEVGGPGMAAYLITLRLIERLILRDAISLTDAHELVDAALIDAEISLGGASGGEPARRYIETFLNSLARPPTS